MKDTLQPELFEIPEEEQQEPHSVYVYHKTNDYLQLYGETMKEGNGKITICIDKINDDNMRVLAAVVYDFINKKVDNN